MREKRNNRETKKLAAGIEGL